MERQAKRLERKIRISEKWITKMTAYMLKIKLKMKEEKEYYNILKKELKKFEREKQNAK